ncbi:SMP-30/gluconolactonase/LRE family protein [Rhodophyticola sp. CCM32]|uniref:SMP-30/gluconolactonase/LRE family protein n=1 Tax=Rhodophyticola sp. CCM32 TaxID=2916397 RepID=UPI00107F20AF|nr:SMP-30/gluconolactonase/LRE family protein [Rhodophyticola sp. CCM32]QBY01575.1 SMP-30/gluconolactonase/LRE family protein [Rhodophyticola sp. CCM32]
MSAGVFDTRSNELGEGPLWHPRLEQLFWFDILGKRLFTKPGETRQEWLFDRYVSAAGWVDDHVLLMASETDLFCFDITTGAQDHLVPLDAENAATRSNDGRADPHGGFWIGTMGKQAEPEAGAIYRYYRGELRRLYDRITIPNAICFAPGGAHAYFTDTAERIVWRQVLDGQGWPVGTPEIYLDHRETGRNPDGAVVDRDGRFVCAEWGSWRVAVYDPSGRFLEEIPLPVEQVSCPAFGGGRLHITTAREGFSADQRAAHPQAGMTFVTDTDLVGQDEARVIL